MPYRRIVSEQMSRLFNVLSHPLRVRIVEELSGRELPVMALKDLLGIPQAAVSQQLAVLRTHGLIVERREGRQVYYHLRQPELAAWLVEGMAFISPDRAEVDEMLSAIENARTVWSARKEES